MEGFIPINFVNASIFGVFILGMLAVDLFSHKSDEPISLKNASIWSAIWVGVGTLFGMYVWSQYGADKAMMYFSGYALEKSLAVDNLFVFMAIFAAFSIKDKYQHRILYYGILGALILRMIFIGIGTGLLVFYQSPWAWGSMMVLSAWLLWKRQITYALGIAGTVGTGLYFDYNWILALFGLIVAWSAWQMWQAMNEDEEDIEDYSDHFSVKAVKRFWNVHPKIENHDFFVKKEDDSGVVKTMVTPLLLCLACVEVADVMFAFDSVPAVIAVTQDPYLVYTSNIFAILGLRSMYFLLAAAKHLLCHLEKAVIGILGFISFKMFADVFSIVHIEPSTSLMIVLGGLTFGVVASLIWPEEDNS